MKNNTRTIKTVANQKVVKVDKVETKDKVYAAIEMDALEAAARDLDAGAFKLWIYFSKNQKGFEFALSSSHVAQVFGIKKKQYDNAIKQLIEKGYLVVSKGNNYIFHEIPVVSKGNNDVVSKGNNDVISKGNNELYPKDIRNNTDITYNNTIYNTTEEKPEEKESGETPIRLTKSEAIERYGRFIQNRIPTAIPNVFWINKEKVEFIN